MTKHPIRLVLLLMLISAVIFTASCSLAADKGSKVRLQMKGSPGATYQTEDETKIENVPFDLPKGESMPSTSNHTRVRFETHIESVKPDGSMILSQRVKEFFERMTKGSEKWEFDSTNAASRKAAESNPAMTAFLKKIDTPFRYVQDAAGDLRDPELDETIVDSHARSMIEDSIAQPVVLLPKQEIGISEEWDMGTRSRSFPPIGKLIIHKKAVLLNVYREGEEEIAKIGIKGSIDLEPDPDSSAKIVHESSKLEGEKKFSITRGRFIYEYEKQEWIDKIILKDGTFRMRTTSESHFKEL